MGQDPQIPLPALSSGNNAFKEESMLHPGLAGSTVVVTGAARGIGAGIAAALAKEGAKLVLVDSNTEALAATAAKLRGSGATLLEFSIDITETDAVVSAIDASVAQFGGVDGLVNVAAILHLQELLEQDRESFDRTFEVNVMGTFLVTQAVARVMARQKRGSVVTIASVAGRFPRMRQGAYCASKAAVFHLTNCFGLELAAAGVRCNTVSPGPTETEMVMDVVKKLGSAERLVKGVPEEFRGGIPLGRLVQVDSVVSAVLWLLSDAASQVTMQHISVDGGQSLGI
jgi:2,3-dihydro-2,3-dihydroxybenzoate dehydrogenase